MEIVANSDVPEIDVESYAQQRQQAEAPALIDVREDWEVAKAALEGAIHIPLQELPERMSKLDPARPYVVMCRSGGRSAKATDFLRRQGFADVTNLAGGIDAWARRIDPTVPRYGKA